MNIEGKKIKLQIWDTAGQERFRTITQRYYKDSAAIFLVYNSTDRKSFDSITQWMKQIEQYANPEVLKMLIANKIDLDGQEVESHEGSELAESFGIPFFECSAKTGEGIEEMFMFSAKKLILPKKKKKRFYLDKKKNQKVVKKKWRLCNWFTKNK